MSEIRLQNLQNPGDQDLNNPLTRPKVQALPIKAPNREGQNLIGKSANPLMSGINWDSKPNIRENSKFPLDTSQNRRAAQPRYSQNRGSAMHHGESREMTPNPLLGRYSVDQLSVWPPKSGPLFSPYFTLKGDQNLPTKAAYKPYYRQHQELSTGQAISNGPLGRASLTNTANQTLEPSVEILNSSKPNPNENQFFPLPARPR
jgi:hypothetical protein